LGDSEYDEEDTEEDYERCSICLQSYVDRTVVPTCSHEFCFECVLVWTEQSRRCPLCSQNIGDHLIHHIRSKYDFQKHFLPPLPTSPRPQTLLPLPARRRAQFRGNGRRREARWGRDERREREQERIAVDEFERAVEKRKWVYRHRLYAKHVASNPYTRYKPCPTPAQFSASQDLITRATIFVRRELRVWGCLDVEFLTTFTVSLLKSIDIRSEPAVKLLSEFLDLDSEHELQVVSRNDSPRANAEHFAHELYCYLRSPYRSLAAYDSSVQYDPPVDVPPPHQEASSRRWRMPEGSISRKNSPSRSRVIRESSPPRSHSSSPRLASPVQHRRRSIARSPSPPRYRRERQRSPSYSPSHHHDNHKTDSGKGKERAREDYGNISFSKASSDEKQYCSPRRTDSNEAGFHSSHTIADPTPTLLAHTNDTSLPSTHQSAAEVPSSTFNGLQDAKITASAITTDVKPDGNAGRSRAPRRAWESVQAHLQPSSRPQGSKPDSNRSMPQVSTDHLAFQFSIRGAASVSNEYDNRAKPQVPNKRLTLLERLSESTHHADRTGNTIAPPYASPIHNIRSRTTQAVEPARDARSNDVLAAGTSDGATTGTVENPSKSIMGTQQSVAANDKPANNPLPHAGYPATVQSSTSSTLRPKLLDKLEEERRIQECKDPQVGLPVDDTAVDSHVASASRESPIASIRTDHAHRTLAGRIEAEEREAELRRRTQLRARVAAAKKVTVDYERSGDGSQELEGLGAEGERHGGGREALLRGKLRMKYL